MIKKLNTLITLFKAQTAVEKQVKESLKNTGLNLNEFAVIEALYSHKTLTTQALIDKILIPNSSMTYVLDQLEKKKFIVRAADTTDKRIKHLRLSSHCAAQFPQIYAQHYQHMSTLFDEALSQAEQKTLQDLLKKLGKTAERNR